MTALKNFQRINVIVEAKKWSIKVACILLACLYTLPVRAQTQETPDFQWSGYLEAYYCYDLGNPLDHRRPSFTYALRSPQ